jgi:hemerythrin-like metal-binding protein
MIIKWMDEYSVGVKDLDAHHQHIISILNKLFAAIGQGNNQRAVIETLHELRDYASYHFQAEEVLMHKHNYPGTDHHMQEHEEFRNKLQRIQDLAKKNDDFSGLELMEFLSSWLTNHVLTEDMKYVPYLTGN